MRAYAQQSGISERRLGLWRRRLERQDADASPTMAKPSGFVAVRIQDSSSLEIVVGEGIRIRVDADCDFQLLRRTVEALRC